MYSAFGVDHGEFAKSRTSEGKAYRKKSNNAAWGSIGGTAVGYTGAHVASAAHDNKRLHESDAAWDSNRAKHYKARGIKDMNEASRHIGEYRANPEGFHHDKVTWDAKMANHDAVSNLKVSHKYAQSAKDSLKAAKKAKNWRTAGITAGVGGLGAGVGLVGRSIHFDNKAKAKGQ